MGRYYTFVNLDSHEQGIGSDGIKFGETTIDPNADFLRRILHPDVIKKLPALKNLVLPSSAEMRPHLGRLNIAAELWTEVLSHLTDMISVACFGAAHPLLSRCALERLRDIMISLKGVGAWAGHRVAFINEHYRPSLSKEVFTETEWKEYNIEEDGLHYSEEFTDVGGTMDTIHREEWLARREVWGYSWLSENVKAAERWRLAQSKRRDYDKAFRMDYRRVWKSLEQTERVEMYRLRAGEYTLCNMTKREYVLARDVAKFNPQSGYEGPYIHANWALGDTAGFLIACDEDLVGGNGQGRWAGDRICVTTVDLMKDMEGLGEWKNIGLFLGDDGFTGEELWKEIDENMGRSFGGGQEWKCHYYP